MGIESLLHLIIWIVIVAVIFWCVWWFVGYVGLPEPFNKVARVLIGLVALIVVLYLLLALLGPVPSIGLHR